MTLTVPRIVDSEGRVFFPCYGCRTETDIAWEYQAGDDSQHVFAFCRSCLARLDSTPLDMLDAS